MQRRGAYAEERSICRGEEEAVESVGGLCGMRGDGGGGEVGGFVGGRGWGVYLLTWDFGEEEEVDWNWWVLGILVVCVCFFIVMMALYLIVAFFKMAGQPCFEENGISPELCSRAGA